MHDFSEAAGVRINYLWSCKLGDAANDNFDEFTFAATKMKLTWVGAVTPGVANNERSVHA